jgi:tetratricopeptide (TPR) repeat protein
MNFVELASNQIQNEAAEIPPTPECYICLTAVGATETGCACRQDAAPCVAHTACLIEFASERDRSAGKRNGPQWSYCCVCGAQYASPTLRVALAEAALSLVHDMPSTAADKLRAVIMCGTAYNMQHMPYRAVGLFRTVVALAERHDGNDEEYARLSMDAKHALAVTLRMLGRYDEAIALFQEIIRLESGGPGPLQIATITTIVSYAYALSSHGELERAIPILRHALETMQDTIGAESEDTLCTKCTLAQALVALSPRNWDTGRTMLLEALVVKTRVFGPNHTLTRATAGDLSIVDMLISARSKCNKGAGVRAGRPHHTHSTEEQKNKLK